MSRTSIVISGLCGFAVLVASAGAQEQPQERTLFPKPRYRQLVEGVERTINPERDFFELSSIHDVTEVVDVDPEKFKWARDKVFRHDIWAFEFTFKPVRMIRVDLPSPGGKLQQKLIWYMVYRIKNPGVIYRVKPTVYEPKPQYGERELQILGDRDVDPARKDFIDGEVVTLSEEDYIRDLVQHYAQERGVAPDQVDLNDAALEMRVPRFVPTFLLYSIDTGGKTYLDRVIPAAQVAVQKREDPNRPLRNTVQITGRIPVSGENEDNSVWGVVCWEGIDPRTDYFSIYIQGLTNAYRWQDLGPGQRWFARKTLRLDFWRPGDDIAENEAEIRFLRARWLYLDSKWASKPN